jgi:hypothetical protein
VIGSSKRACTFKRDISRSEWPRTYAGLFIPVLHVRRNLLSQLARTAACPLGLEARTYSVSEAAANEIRPKTSDEPTYPPLRSFIQPISAGPIIPPTFARLAIRAMPAAAASSARKALGVA